MRTFFTVTWLTLAALFAAGCEATKTVSPLITNYDQQNATADLDYWHGLAEQPITTNNDAFHGLIELAVAPAPGSTPGNADTCKTYDERVAWLKDHQYLDASFDRPADEAARRGTVAQIICRIKKIDGGLTMHVLGANPRYATRELVYLRIMRPGTEQQALSGMEFVGIVGKAQDYEGVIP
ncbi:MAG: hypothetical protein WC058_11005 [Phycisphaeraceae bacterium]